jgi:murein DD-endopeptidase MepM/ murein hydrolase activator NlpD
VAIVRAQSEQEATNLVASKQERKSMLSQIRSKKSEHNQAIKELEKAQEEVKDLIGALEKRRLASQLPGGGDFKTLKGRMMWPVEGKVVRKYGKQTHPKYGTVTFNNGIDIGAAQGTPIVAVAPGIVEYVDWIDAYGKCIIINHGDGYYTLYAHVSATFVRQDQQVGVGDVIAEVGDTGSLDGYECHFEIRHSKQAMNPLDWLSPSRKGGASR